MLGLSTVHGEPMPTLDLRVRLEYEATVRPGSWVVVSSDGRRTALKVDSVDGILSFSDVDIEASPASADPAVEGVARHGHERVVILEADRLVA
jgi:chemotaxis signal transduction protein